MVAGQWTNLDGLPLNFGTSKAVPEMGGDYMTYGESRVAEFYVTYGQAVWGTGSVPAVPALGVGPWSAGISTVTNATNPANIGVVSQTLLWPLQTTVASGAGSAAQTGFVTTSSTLNLVCSQLFVEQMEFEVLSNFNGTTGFSVGLAAWNPVSANFGIVSPNVNGSLTVPQHFFSVSSAVMANFTAGYKVVYGPGGMMYNFVPGVGTNAASASCPTVVLTAGQQLGNISATTGIFSGAAQVTTNIPSQAFIVAVSTAAMGSTAAGLAKVRLKYYVYGNIIQ